MKGEWAMEAGGNTGCAPEVKGKKRIVVTWSGTF